MPGIEKETINAREAIGYVVRSYDRGKSFEKATEVFLNSWGFDPSQEDLRKPGRKWIVNRLKLPRNTDLLLGLCEKHSPILNDRLLRTLMRDLIHYERHQKWHCNLWEVACKQLIQWIFDGKLRASGRPAFFDGHQIVPNKLRETIPSEAAEARTTAFVRVYGSKAENSFEDYWLVRNYVDLFDDRFGEYQAARPSWAEVSFLKDDVFALAGLPISKPAASIPVEPVLLTTNTVDTMNRPICASVDKIREVLNEIYEHASLHSMKPPNVKEAGIAGRSLLPEKGFAASQAQVSKVAEEMIFKTRRLRVGQRARGRFLAFSLAGFGKSGPEI